MHGSPQVCDSTFRVCRYKPQKLYVNFLRGLHMCLISGFPVLSVPHGCFICPEFAEWCCLRTQMKRVDVGGVLDYGGE